uniref:Elongin-B n=1 Tax=Gouania willdenowi TaxID=441366 RepID=A0A8C5EE21_GOUWI
MDVFLMIRRHKTTIFTDAKESTTVYDLKRIVEGILKRPPEEQRLYKDDVLLNDSQTLGNCGFTNQTARPQAPATVGLAFRLSDDSFEQLRMEPFSTPPELPDVMKPQDSGCEGALAHRLLRDDFRHSFRSQLRRLPVSVLKAKQMNCETTAIHLSALISFVGRTILSPVFPSSPPQPSSTSKI